MTMDEHETYVGIHEAADVTGYTIGYLRKLAARGKIPHYRPTPRSHLLFLVSELRIWLRGDWSPSSNEPSTDV